MADLLIGVGGTGQHVALAASRLVFLGALPEMELAVIDADDNQELSNSLKTFGGTVEDNLTEHPLINGEKIYNPFDKTIKEDPEFQDLLLSQHPEPAEREVFDLCFEEESAAIHVKDGMFGRPSVGATVFAHNKDAHLKPVFERVDLANNIIVTGSMVGGTGAGLIHQLVKRIDAKGRRIYGLLFLRWFAVPRGSSKQTINDGALDRNMRYGLDYFFKDTRQLLKATLLLGVPDNPPDERVKPIVLEAGKNDEKKHYFQMAAGYALLKLLKIAVVEETDGSIYAATYDSDHPMQMYDEVWGDKPLHWYINRGNFVTEILDYASSTKFKTEIKEAFGLFGRGPKNIGNGLYEAIGQYDKRQRDTKIDEITRTWALLSKQYKFSLSWIEEVLGHLPKDRHHSRYTKVATGDPAEIAREIQSIWARPFVKGQEILSAPAVAKMYHKMLVESFE